MKKIIFVLIILMTGISAFSYDRSKIMIAVDNEQMDPKDFKYSPNTEAEKARRLRYPSLPEHIKKLYDQNFRLTTVGYVDSPEGLRVRDTGSTLGRVITKLDNDTYVIINKAGKQDTIDGITSVWLNILIPEEYCKKGESETGWVFGGYISRYESYYLDDDLIDDKVLFSNNKFKIWLSKTNTTKSYVIDDEDLECFKGVSMIDCIYLQNQEKTESRFFVQAIKAIEDDNDCYHYQGNYFVIMNNRLVKFAEIISKSDCIFKEHGEYMSTLSGADGSIGVWEVNYNYGGRMHHDDVMAFKFTDEYPYVMFDNFSFNNYTMIQDGPRYDR